MNKVTKPRQARTMIRRGTWNGSTTYKVPGYVQCNLCVLRRDVAFIITKHDEIALTEREAFVSEKLKTLGYKITYVPFNRVAVSDFSKARFVIATEYPTLDSNTVQALLESSKGLMLLYNAAIPLGGSWSREDLYWDDWSGYLYSEKDAACLRGYLADLSFQVQSRVKENYGKRRPVPIPYFRK